MREATWAERIARHGHTPHRLALLAGLKAALDALRAAGCRRSYVDLDTLGDHSYVGYAAARLGARRATRPGRPRIAWAPLLIADAQQGG